MNKSYRTLKNGMPTFLSLGMYPIKQNANRETRVECKSCFYAKPLVVNLGPSALPNLAKINLNKKLGPNHNILCLSVQEHNELKFHNGRNILYQTFRNPNEGWNLEP